MNAQRVLLLLLPAFHPLLPFFAVDGCLAQSAPPYGSTEPVPVPAIFEPGIISTGDDESHPAFTPDGTTLYYLINTPTFSHWTIVRSSFADGRWNIPEVAPFSGRYSDADPFITPDGGTMFFISTRPVDGRPKDDTDIWMMEKTSSGWGEPRHLDSSVNSVANEWFPTVANNGTLYFGSEREGGKGRNDIWRCKLVDGKYGPAENLGDPINSPAGEYEPFISPDESFMILAAAGRQDSKGAFDLYVSYHADGIWSVPWNLGDGINSIGWDFSPKLSPDGKYFFFTSSRGFADAPLEKKLTYDELLDRLHNPGNGLRDIYRVDIEALKLTR